MSRCLGVYREKTNKRKKKRVNDESERIKGLKQNMRGLVRAIVGGRPRGRPNSRDHMHAETHF